ncbi:MAG: transposase [Candidatus Heimdallarchaeota archaeon]
MAHTLEYKCQEKGLCLQKVCPWNTSSHCPRCTKEGLKVKGPNDLAADPKGRWFYCFHCGFEGDRDYIAALNIFGASFIDFRKFKSLKNTSPIPYMEMGTLRSTVPSGGPEMTQNGLVVVTGYG